MPPHSKKLTKTEQAIWDIIKDGLPHTRALIHKTCMGPSSVKSLKGHMFNLRQKLPNGYDILCVFRQKKLHYQLIRLVASANDGRT